MIFRSLISRWTATNGSSRPHKLFATEAVGTVSGQLSYPYKPHSTTLQTSGAKARISPAFLQATSR
jgi:hypothetical protein